MDPTSTDAVPVEPQPLPQKLADRVTTLWHENVAKHRKVQGYLKGRTLWAPELLRALRVGYSTGRLAQMTAGHAKLRRQLQAGGLLNEKGNEVFYNRVVIPFHDEAGELVAVYGRSLAVDNVVPHLYRRGPLRGVFNRVGIQGARTVLLAEAPLDALSLMILGFQATSSFGAGGFTTDLRAALVRAKTSRVYCVYDADPAGDRGADQVAHDLAGHGIEVLRVVLPSNCKDPNDFLKSGGTHDELQALIDKARPILTASESQRPGGETTARPAPSPAAYPPAATEATTPMTFSTDLTPDAPAAPAPPPAEASAALTLPLGDRTYQLEALPEIGPGNLRVMLRVTRGGRTFVDSLNLYSDRARATFVSRLVTVFRGQVPRKELEEDFFAVLDQAETLSQRAIAPVTTPALAMTEADRAEALAFLKRHDLIAQVLENLVRLGVVGEDDNKLLAYLVATSRKLDRPLSLSIISGSSAGKSWLLNRIVDLMPPEEVLRFTRMSPRALFYDEPGRYKNKILHIEEAIGAKDADLGVRSMQSERRLANLVTMTDPKTGKLKTQETVVEGPLTYMTSSVEPLDYETGTRSFEVTIDESPEQTERIVTRELAEQGLEAIQERLANEAIIARHRNAQRLLEPLIVVNPYWKQLRFPKHILRLRREVNKYIGLMKALALLFQHQRTIKTFTDAAGQEHRYVQVAREDIAIANRLMALHLTRALSDLPGPAQKVLLAIQAFVTEEAEARGADPLAISFNRRQIRERMDCSDYELNGSLEKLAKLEYIEVASGSFGKRYVYTLTPEHRLLVQAGLGIDERIEALGLTPVSQLKEPDEE